MTDPTPRKRRGRPPLDPDDPSVTITFRVPSKEYDRVYQRTQRDRVALGDFIRRRLRDDERPK